MNKLRESGSIDCVHDITIGYPAGLIQGESDLADGKMPKEGLSFQVVFTDCPLVQEIGIFVSLVVKIHNF